MPFTPEELAEMAAADAEIEAAELGNDAGMIGAAGLL